MSRPIVRCKPLLRARYWDSYFGTRGLHKYQPRCTPEIRIARRSRIPCELLAWTPARDVSGGLLTKATSVGFLSNSPSERPLKWYSFSVCYPLSLPRKVRRWYLAESPVPLGQPADPVEQRHRDQDPMGQFRPETQKRSGCHLRPGSTIDPGLPRISGTGELRSKFFSCVARLGRKGHGIDKSRVEGRLHSRTDGTHILYHHGIHSSPGSYRAGSTPPASPWAQA